MGNFRTLRALICLKLPTASACANHKMLWQTFERQWTIGRASQQMPESHPLSGTEWRKIFFQYEGEASSIGILAVCQPEGPVSKKGESGLPPALTRWSGFSSHPGCGGTMYVVERLSSLPVG